MSLSKSLSLCICDLIDLLMARRLVSQSFFLAPKMWIFFKYQFTTNLLSFFVGLVSDFEIFKLWQEDFWALCLFLSLVWFLGFLKQKEIFLQLAFEFVRSIDRWIVLLLAREKKKKTDRHLVVCCDCCLAKLELFACLCTSQLVHVCCCVVCWGPLRPSVRPSFRSCVRVYVW